MERVMDQKSNEEPVPGTAPAGIIVEGHYAPPPADEDGKQWVRTSALVLRSPAELYDLWRDIEKASLWQEQIVEVRAIDPQISHWVMQAGDAPDKTIEWDSQILNDEPSKRIAWRSIAGDSDNAGEVVFEKMSGDRGTMVTVLQEFRMGKLASAWETVTGRNPKQAVIENLRHFKALAESGEIPRNQGQPHGPRGVVGKTKKSLYGETTATPEGSRRNAS